jgi:hypothetical protein
MDVACGAPSVLGGQDDRPRWWPTAAGGGEDGWDTSRWWRVGHCGARCFTKAKPCTPRRASDVPGRVGGVGQPMGESDGGSAY